MDAPLFYVETSAWGSLAPRQPADRKQAVRRLLGLLDRVRGYCVISPTVLEEIEDAKPAVAKAIHQQVLVVQPLVFPTTEQVRELAAAYLEEEVLPQRRRADALHVAAATVLNCDYLVTWNHRHLTRPKKKLQFQAVNLLCGHLHSPMICNPFEAYDELRHQ